MNLDQFWPTSVDFHLLNACTISHIMFFLLTLVCVSCNYIQGTKTDEFTTSRK